MRPRFHLRARILVPSLLLLVLCLTASLWIVYTMKEQSTKTLVNSRLDSVHLLFDDALEQETHLLDSALLLMERDPALQAAWQEQNREVLLAEAMPIFRMLRERYRVTHFYFTSADGICFLRVHEPDRHGDRIERITQHLAQEKNAPAQGIELGPLGTFALRVVHPWVIDDRVTGYLELGMEIAHIAPRLAQILQSQIIVSIDKTFLDRKMWELGQEFLGHGSEWNTFPDFVISLDSSTNLQPEVAAYLRTSGARRVGRQVTLSTRNAAYRTGNTPLVDAGGRPVGTITMLVDVTQSQADLRALSRRLVVLWVAISVPLLLFLIIFLGRLEEKLVAASMVLARDAQREPEARYQALTDNLDLGVAQIGSDMRIQMINRRIKEWFPHIDPSGPPPCHQMFRAQANADACKLCPIARTLRDGRRHSTLRTLHDEQGLRYFHLVATPLHDEQGRVTAAILMLEDTTDRVLADENLLRAKERAEVANVAKSEFLANMSHEIRTPMNGIIALTDLVMETGLSDEQVQHMKVVQSSGASLLGLINQILDLSKVESGRLELVAVPFSLAECLDKVMDEIRPQAISKGLAISHTIPPDIPNVLLGDQERLRQILVNLIGNAVKFTEEGEVRVDVETRRLGTGVFRLHVTVEDTGVGIPREQQSRIFEPFTQADGSTTRRFGGTGLGLTIAKTLVQFMNGVIWVDSQPGAGSTFHFTADLQQAEIGLGAADEPVDLAHARIMVADPSLAGREHTIRTLENFGANPQEAEGALEALQLIQEAARAGQPFHILILSDDIAQQIGGELKEPMTTDLAVLLIGSADPQRIAQEMLERGVAAYVSVDADKWAMRKAIENCLVRWWGWRAAEPWGRKSEKLSTPEAAA